MPRYLFTVTVTLLLAASGATLAGEIYKWVDEDGTTHYVDRPTGDPTEERMNVASRNTNSGSVQASVEARRERVAAREEARAKKSEEQSAAAQAKADKEKRAADCQMYRARMESFLQSQRLYREDESGGREYLDEAQILAARNKVQDKIQETCD
jgi:hypothetical protein